MLRLLPLLIRHVLSCGVVCIYFDYLKNLCMMIEDDYYALEGFLTEKVSEKCYEAVSGVFRPRSYDDLYGKKIDFS